MKKKYVIKSLVAAGFFGGVTNAHPSLPTENLVSSEPEKRLIDILRYEQIYNIAGHRSHSSHGSHRSSSGGSVRRAPVSKPSPVYRSPVIQKKPPSSRNLATTPNTSILPSSPAITNLTTLPGHSEKFKKIVMEVQLALFAFGYYAGAIDGFLGPETKRALAKFQVDSKMTVTGTINGEVMKVFGVRVK